MYIAVFELFLDFFVIIVDTNNFITKTWYLFTATLKLQFGFFLSCNRLGILNVVGFVFSFWPIDYFSNWYFQLLTSFVTNRCEASSSWLEKIFSYAKFSVKSLALFSDAQFQVDLAMFLTSLKLPTESLLKDVDFSKLSPAVNLIQTRPGQFLLFALCLLSLKLLASVEIVVCEQSVNQRLDTSFSRSQSTGVESRIVARYCASEILSSSTDDKTDDFIILDPSSICFEKMPLSRCACWQAVW